MFMPGVKVISKRRKEETNPPSLQPTTVLVVTQMSVLEVGSPLSAHNAIHLEPRPGNWLQQKLTNISKSILG
jgi:hypothetical protein